MDLFCNSNSDVVFSDTLFQLEEEIKNHTIKYVFNNNSDKKNRYVKSAIKEKIKNKITNINNIFNERKTYCDDEHHAIKDLENKCSNNTSNLEIIEYPIHEINNNKNNNIDNILITKDKEYLNNQNQSNLFKYLKENQSSNYLDLLYEDNTLFRGLNKINKETNEENNSSKSDEIICSYIEVDNSNSHIDMNKKGKNIIKSPSKIFSQIFKNNSENIAVINKNKQKIYINKSNPETNIEIKNNQIDKKNKKLAGIKKIEENTSGIFTVNNVTNIDNNNYTTCFRKSTNKSFKYKLDSKGKINNFKSLENPKTQNKKYLKKKKTNLKSNNFILIDRLINTCNTINFDYNAQKEKSVKNKCKNKSKINDSNSVNNSKRRKTKVVNNINNLNNNINTNNNTNNNVCCTAGKKNKTKLIKSFWNKKRKKCENENKKFIYLKKNLLSSILKETKKNNNNNTIRIKSNNKLKSTKIPINTFQSTIIKSISKLKKEKKNIFKENEGSREKNKLSPKSLGRRSQVNNKNNTESKNEIKKNFKNLTKKLDNIKEFSKHRGNKTMKRNITDIVNKSKKTLNNLSFDSNLKNKNDIFKNKDKTNNSILEANFHIYNIKIDNLITSDNNNKNKSRSGENSRKKSEDKKENKTKIKSFREYLRTQSLRELKIEEVSVIDAKRNTNSTEIGLKDQKNYKTKNLLSYVNNVKSLKYNNYKKKNANANHLKKTKILEK